MANRFLLGANGILSRTGAAPSMQVGTTPVQVPLPKDGLFWLALCLTVFAVAPFLQPGYFWGANDARHHVYFLFEYDRLVQDGIWWPRWSPDFAFGYGYPFFNIYGPFSHFLAELLLHFLRFSHTGAIKTVFVLSIVASAGTMYAYVRSLAGRPAALLSALVYTYAPYHLLDLYVRANLAESMAFVWLPLCLWTFRECVRRPSWRWVAAAAISHAGLMVTSNLVWFLFTPLLIAYVLVLLAGKWLSEGGIRGLGSAVAFWLRPALAPALGGILGMGLSAVFWLPMVLERQYVLQSQWFDGRYNALNNFLYYFQLFSPYWGFGISQAGPDDGMGFQIGVVPLALAILAGLLIWRHIPRLRLEMGFLALVSGMAAALSLHPFAFLWHWPLVGSILQFAQFPWRWLTLTTLGVAVLAGLVLGRPGGDTGLASVGPQGGAGDGLSLDLLVLVAAVLLGSYPLLQVQIVEPAEGPVSLAALMRFQRDADEMTGSTAWVKEIPTWSDMAEHYVNLEEAGEPVTPVTTKVDYGNVDYETLVLGSVAHNTVMEEVYFCTGQDLQEGLCSPRDDRRIIFNHFYYPGWNAYLLDGLHGEPVQILPIVIEEEGTLGRMTVPLPAVGEGYVLLRYEDTLPRIAGQVLSLGTAALLLLSAMFGLARRFDIDRIWRRRSVAGQMKTEG